MLRSSSISAPRMRIAAKRANGTPRLGVEALRADDQRHHRRGRELVTADVGGYLGEHLADQVSDEGEVVLDEASHSRVGFESGR